MKLLQNIRFTITLSRSKENLVGWQMRFPMLK